MPKQQEPSAHRRPSRLIVSGCILSGLVLGGNWAADNGRNTLALTLAIAWLVVAFLAFVGATRSLGDELDQLLVLRAAAIGYAFSLLVLLTLPRLQAVSTLDEGDTLNLIGLALFASAPLAWLILRFKHR